MEIVLLIAILAVAGSALYVAFTFKNHVKLLAEKTDLDPLTRRADLDPLMRKAVTDASGQATTASRFMQDEFQAVADRQREQIRILRDELTGKLEQLGRQVSTVGTSLALQRELIAGIENRVRVKEVQGADRQEMNALEFALLQAEAFVACEGWGQPPRLFSLSRKSSLVGADRQLEAKLEDADPDALIPMLQDELPGKDPFDALGRIHWHDGVVGCVLVTEFVALPPEAEKDAPKDPAAVEQWARDSPGGKTARLAVGVTRAGSYLCGLRLEGADDIQIGRDLADDLVAALLGTFLE